MKLSLIALALALFGTSNALRLSKETHEYYCIVEHGETICSWEPRKTKHHDA